VSDTLQTVAGLTYSISSDIPAVTGSISIDSMVITSSRDTTVPVRRLAAPIVVPLPLMPTAAVPVEDSLAFLSTCNSIEEAARALASDIYVQIPAPIERGQTWTDSTTLGFCRGGIPLTATRISRFQITDIRESRDTVVARVSRQTKLVLLGSGMQGSRRITVRGEGTSETVFAYDLRAGRFLESTGESQLRLAFETIQQTEQVVQQSRSIVRLRTALPAP
jgi:hypothetical protein